MIVPPGRIPRLDSVVPVVSATLPIAVAGAPDVLVVPDDPEPDEDDAPVALDDDELELPRNTLSTAAVRSELTRFKAVPLAMLESPFPRLVSAD